MSLKEKKKAQLILTMMMRHLLTAFHIIIMGLLHIIIVMAFSIFRRTNNNRLPLINLICKPCLLSSWKHYEINRVITNPIITIIATLRVIMIIINLLTIHLMTITAFSESLHQIISTYLVK